MRRLVSPVLVGRTGELAQLRAAAARAAGGEPGVVLVGGEAGVGKTRLVEDATSRLADEGTRVLTGACVELGGEGLPFAPLVDAVRELTRTLSAAELDDALGPARASLARLLPELDPSAASGPAVDEREATRLFELVLGMLGRLAEERPLALVIEDLHWADRSTLDLVAFLVRALRGAPVLLVATYRSDELHRRHPLRPLLATLERVRSVERIELQRFSRAEVAEQLQAILGSPADATLVDLVYQRSEGNAFLVEEMLGIVESGAGAAGLPPSLRDVLLARADQLSEPAQRVLRTAAATGSQVTDRLLAAVTGLAEPELLDALRETVEHHLLVVDERGAGYGFRHALVRDAIYDDMLPGERARLHAAFGAAIEADPALAGEDTSAAGALAYHWYAAHDVPRALSASVQAARQALAAYAPADATRHCERALELWDRVEDAEKRTGLDAIGLLELSVHAALSAGDERRALTLTDVALAEPALAAQPRRTALLLERRAEALRRFGGPDVSVLEHALELLDDTPSFELATVLASLATGLVLRDETDRARVVGERAVTVGREVGARDVVAQALMSLGGAVSYLGQPEQGLAFMREALDLALELGDHLVALRAYANISDSLELVGRHQEAADVAEQGIELARRVGGVRSVGLFLAGNRAESLARLGRLREAEQLAAEATAMGPDSSSAASLQVVRGEIAVTAGRVADARVCAAAARQILGDDPPVQYDAPIAFVEAEAARLEGDAVQARATLARAIDASTGVMLARYTWPLVWLALRIEADAAEPDRDRIGALTTLAGELPTVTPAARAYRALAGAERMRAQREPAAGAWRTATAAWREAAEPAGLAYALMRVAEAFAADGDRAEAEAAIGEALELARAMGAEPLETDATAMARRERLPIATATERAPGGDRFGLTDREREVLRLVADGHSNGEIAKALYISPKTASVHVSNILAKLGVARRGEAAAIAHRLGLGVVDEPAA